MAKSLSDLTVKGRPRGMSYCNHALTVAARLKLNHDKMVVCGDQQQKLNRMPARARWSKSVLARQWSADFQGDNAPPA